MNPRFVKLDRGHRVAQIALEHDAFVFGPVRNEFQNIFRQGVHLDRLPPRFATLGKRKHVHRQGIYLVKVPVNDVPSLTDSLDLLCGEPHLDEL